jgi:murein DD-endopeptidase MepM/ murein hydrolase activator NlpD
MKHIALTLAIFFAAVAAHADERKASPTQVPIKPIIKVAAAGFTLDRAAEQGNIIIGQAPAGALSLSLDGLPVKLAADGAFLVAFHRDAAATARLAALMPDGRSVTQDITVKPRVYSVQKVDGLPPKTVVLSAEDELRRKGEVAKIVASRAVVSDLQGWRQAFVWPATGRISGVYGSQRIRNGVPGSPHFGVDVARPTGTPIVAPADGVVVLAEPDMLLEGGLLIIDHGHGLFSDYLHLSRIDVKVGDVLKQGQAMAAIGGTGRATGPHLHWGMRWAATRLDPSRLAGPQTPKR